MQKFGPQSWSSLNQKPFYKRISLQTCLIIAAVISVLLASASYAHHARTSGDKPESTRASESSNFKDSSSQDPSSHSPSEPDDTKKDEGSDKENPDDDKEKKEEKPSNPQKPGSKPRKPGSSGGGGGGSDGGGDGGGSNNPPVTSGKKCTLNLHWAGGNGQSDSATIDSGGYWKLWPSSPGGAFWLYDGPHNSQYDPGTGHVEYNAIVNFLTNYLDSRNCGPVLIIGYSNGGGLAAKLFCKGEDFGGRAWGIIVDDPVMDEGVLGCNPSPNIREVLFTHSTELINAAAAAVGGNHCSWDPPYTSTPRPGQGTGWYCENNRTMTLAQYQNHVGHTSILQREFHGGGGWTNNTYAAWNQEYVFWTTRF